MHVFGFDMGHAPDNILVILDDMRKVTWYSHVQLVVCEYMCVVKQEYIEQWRKVFISFLR